MTDAMTSGACMKNSSLDYSSINACIRMGSAFIVIGYFSKNVYEIKNVRRNIIKNYGGFKLDLILLNILEFG